MRRRSVFLIALAWRLVNVFTIQTFFQPDEYWQSLEPAHILTYGYGYQTWEWKEQIRSALYPLILAGAMRLGEQLGIKSPLVCTKILQAVIAATGDFYTASLGSRVFGGSRSGQILLVTSLFSAFNWYCSTRTFSNSVEMVLTTVALNYWPFSTLSSNQEPFLAFFIAAMSCYLRPTNALIWIFFALVFLLSSRSLKSKLAFVRSALCAGSVAIAINFVADWLFYGEPCFPIYNFYIFNVVKSLSSFYGVNQWHYYLSQGLPLLLLGYLPPFLVGLWSAKNALTKQLYGCLIGVILVFSLLNHKEVRFVYPLIPVLHLLVSIPLSRHKWLFAIAIPVNVLVAGYVTLYHQRGVIDVVNYLHNAPEVESVGFLMPCHSTPWQSHIHRDIPAWFLTCEPPLHLDSAAELSTYLDEADIFYEDPILFIANKLGTETRPFPSHLIIFEPLEDIVKHNLADYHECSRFFNSHFHHDSRATGDVIVYCKI